MDSKNDLSDLEARMDRARRTLEELRAEHDEVSQQSQHEEIDRLEAHLASTEHSWPTCVPPVRKLGMRSGRPSKRCGKTSRTGKTAVPRRDNPQADALQLVELKFIVLVRLISDLDDRGWRPPSAEEDVIGLGELGLMLGLAGHGGDIVM